MTHRPSGKHREKLTGDQGRLSGKRQQAGPVEQCNNRDNKILGAEHPMDQLIGARQSRRCERGGYVGVGGHPVERSLVLPSPVHLFFHLAASKLRMIAIAWPVPVDIKKATERDFVFFGSFKPTRELRSIEADKTVHDHSFIQSALKLLMG